jgi:hypothetical protein
VVSFPVTTDTEQEATASTSSLRARREHSGLAAGWLAAIPARVLPQQVGAPRPADLGWHFYGIDRRRKTPQTCSVRDAQATATTSSSAVATQRTPAL